MIISRTPFRISFFGGGTDYPAWYKENGGGAVLATTINKYCYISCRYLPPFFEHKSRIIWTQVECVKNTSEILHPSVRACLQFMKMNKGTEIHHDGDLPARAGMGSSSAFTVGLLHSLYALKRIEPTKRQLVLNAIHLEQKIMRESVGSQDQVLAAFGGLNLIEFGGKNHFSVKPLILSSQRLQCFQSHLMLFFTGFSRNSSAIAAELVKKIPHKKKELKTMRQMVHAASEMLSSHGDLSEFGRLLHENWQLKRSLSHKISIPLVDEIYSTAIKAGALGGKLLGAGGGGFVLIFAKPEAQQKVKEKLKKFLYVPFKFESLGSQIIFRNHNGSLVNP